MGNAALVAVTSLPPKSASKSSNASVAEERAATTLGNGPATSPFGGRGPEDDDDERALALALLAAAPRSKLIPLSLSPLLPLLVDVPVTEGGFFVSPVGNEPNDENSLRIPALADEDSEEEDDEEVPDDGNGSGGGSGDGMTLLPSLIPHSSMPRLLSPFASIGRVCEDGFSCIFCLGDEGGEKGGDCGGDEGQMLASRIGSIVTVVMMGARFSSWPKLFGGKR